MNTIGLQGTSKMENIKQLSAIIRTVAGLMLLVAISDLPYSYYQLLRIVICGASLFLVWYFIKAKIEWLGWIFIIPAILFNPIFPIYLDKYTWQLVDLIFGSMFILSLSTWNMEKRVE